VFSGRTALSPAYTRFTGGPVLEALERRAQLVSAAADPEHFGDRDHDHHASLVDIGPRAEAGTFRPG
jgi:hypothetical protein